MEVYKAIAEVAAELGKQGISKDKKNVAQGFSFRGIDDIYNALNSVMSKHGLVMLPRMVDRACVDRVTAKGTSLFYVTVTAEFDLIAASDGSKHTIRTYGEAMDSGDKATNKAMSAAYKYAAFQAFCIPTEANSDDADAQTHTEIVPVAPEGYEAFKDGLWEASLAGTPTLKAKWSTSNKLFREHMGKVEPATWETIKLEAGKVVL